MENNNSPLISVIMPVWNLEKYIEKSIKSILCQTYKNFELIIIDNNSKDKTQNIIETIMQQDKRVALYQCPKQGISFARNEGLSFVKGQYIGWVDGDDIIEPNYLMELYSNLVSGDYDMSICNYKWERKISKLKLQKNVKKETYDNLTCIEHMICSNPYSGILWNKLFKKEILGDMKFNESLTTCEDLPFCYHYLMKCKKVIYTNKILYHYLNHKESSVNNKFSLKKLGFLDALEEIVDSSKDIKSINNCARAWKGMQAVFILYLIKRDHYKDKQLKKMLKHEIKICLPYIKKCKYMKWYIKYFSHLIYFIALMV